jgi:serine/threonine-protein kinase
VGVVVFRTLTGRLPFVSRSLEAVIRMKAEQGAPPLSTMPNMPKNVLLDWFVAKTMAREPQDRFQSAREMLEHWWNVMGSFDEDATTDVMRGIGRVDESYAGPLRRTRRDTTPQVVAGPPPAAEEDRTLRRMPAVGQPPQPPYHTQPAQPAQPASAAYAVAPPTTDPGPPVFDQAPNTVPTPATTGSDPRDDPFDMPTRSDPNLRQLVERELELHRKRKGTL